MQARQAMRYGEEGLHPDVVEGWRRLLLQYCRLDRLARVAVWRHYVHAIAARVAGWR